MSNDKTKWVYGNDAGGDGFTENVGGGAASADAPTVGLEDDRTKLSLEDADKFEDRGPVVGWLVVVKGPGLGSAVELTTGRNEIGRQSDRGASLDFGDNAIHSEGHLFVIYEPRGRSFMVAPGAGQNLSYILNKDRSPDTVIASPMALESHTTLSLSLETDVRFVALCSPEFDWTDVSDAKDA